MVLITTKSRTMKMEVQARKVGQINTTTKGDTTTRVITTSHTMPPMTSLTTTTTEAGTTMAQVFITLTRPSAVATKVAAEGEGDVAEAGGLAALLRRPDVGLFRLRPLERQRVSPVPLKQQTPPLPELVMILLPLIPLLSSQLLSGGRPVGAATSMGVVAADAAGAAGVDGAQFRGGRKSRACLLPRLGFALERWTTAWPLSVDQASEKVAVDRVDQFLLKVNWEPEYDSRGIVHGCTHK